MSLRILFADDSVTAQNMGKKILTEAGYEVVAVSNGAAAVKKIAEQKPDIIILDVYMPGYSGLEVCEKVRASMATIKTPVLLTVGKMEPYRPEDANRVHADGVIIKPFEASDLLAIIKKFEERIGQTTAPAAAPVVAEPAPAPAAEPEPEYEHRQHTTSSNSHFTVDVPDHMATASAFSDLLGSEPGHVVPSFATATSNRVPDLQPLAAAPARAAAAAPDYDVPASWRPEPEVRPAQAQTAVPESTSPRPLQIPVYQEAVLPEYEVVPTSAAPTGELEIPQEPALQENDAEATRNTVADVRDPDLVSTVLAEEQSHEAVRDPGFVPISADSPEMPEASVARQGVAQIASPAPAGPVLEKPSVSENDFEARVAAAMAAYNHPAEETQNAAASSVAAPVEIAEEPPQNFSQSVAEAPSEVPASTPEPPPVFEYQPPIKPMAVVQEMHAERETASAPASKPATAPEPASNPSVQSAEVDFSREDVASTIGAALPEVAVAAAEETGSDHHTIAQAVHRVMERIKGDLVEEIVRELKSKK